MNSVEEKMNMMSMAIPRKKNETSMSKRLGGSNAEIKYLGKSNQKIRRRLG
jgi:hypothetical protein